MSLRARLRTLHVRVLRRLAHDITDPSTTASAVVFAPHPDDETIGCGGVIARKRLAGTEVRVVVAADGGDPIRRAECVEACRRLGVAETDVRFLGFADGALAGSRPELETALLEALGSRPAQIFVPSAVDAHADHRALAAAIASLPADLLGDADVLAYPIWFWNRWAWVDRTTPPWKQRLQLVWRPVHQFVRTRVVSIDTTATLAQQRSALDAHESQLHPVDGSTGLDRDWLDTFLASPAVFFREHSR
jgi:LmbE family N-acetylglucosaminyl deacetylase